MIEAKNLVKTYGKGNAEVNALNGIDLSVKKGEFVSIQGPFLVLVQLYIDQTHQASK